jgi:hypothetical protein
VAEHVYLTSEVEPVFDAADVMRFGNLNPDLNLNLNPNLNTDLNTDLNPLPP